MITGKKIVLTKLSLLAVLSISLSVVCGAQNVKRFAGNYAIEGELYRADFEYRISGGDTIRHGAFKLNKHIDTDDIADPFDAFTISGHYSNNALDGEWVIRFGQFEGTGDRILQDYQFKINVEGRELYAKTRFDNGLKTGQWEVFEWNVMNASVVDTLLVAQISFEKNSLNGNLRFEDKQRLLSGEVGVDALATGTWSFHKKNRNNVQVLTEEWVFEQHQLIQKVRYEDNKTYVFNLVQDTSTLGELEIMDLSPRYFHIINLISLAADSAAYVEVTGKSGMRSFYLSSFNQFHSVDSALRAVTKAEVDLPIKTLIYRFPFTSKEVEILSVVQERLGRMEELIEIIEKDPQVKLSSISKMEVAWYTGVLKSIERRYVQPIKEIVELYESGDLAYIHRNSYIRNALDFNESIKAIGAESDSTFSTLYSFKKLKIDKSVSPLKQLSAFTIDLVEEIKIINDSLNYFMFEIKQEEDLINQEGFLYERFTYVTALNDSMLTDQFNDLAGFDVHQVVETFLKTELSNYTRIESSKEKLQRIKSLLECLEQAETLIFTIENSRDNLFATRDAYTRQVFNAFTFTYMEETIKSTIYKSFDEVLLPSVYGNLKSLKCQNAEDIERNFGILFEGMNEILNKDTRTEQRKIRRVSDPEKAAEILGLPLKFVK